MVFRMRVCVLGGNGFVGSHVTDALRANGHAVTVFDRGAGWHRGPDPGTRYHAGDLRDLASVGPALDDADVVVHLISTSTPGTRWLDPAQDVHGNVVSTIGLLKAAVAAGVRRLVFVSSGGAVYGEQTQPLIDESHPTDPLSSYGIVKLTIEKYVQLFHREYGLDYAILRPSNAYGERQRGRARVGLVSAALASSLNGEPLTIWGDGTVVRDYLYVGDLASAIVAAATRSVNGVFNVGAGQGRTVADILDLVRAVTGRPLAVRHARARAVDPQTNVLDIRRASSALEWRPTTTLEAGIDRTWRWLLDECRATN